MTGYGVGQPDVSVVARLRRYRIAGQVSVPVTIGPMTLEQTPARAPRVARRPERKERRYFSDEARVRITNPETQRQASAVFLKSVRRSPVGTGGDCEQRGLRLVRGGGPFAFEPDRKAHIARRATPRSCFGTLEK